MASTLSPSYRPLPCPSSHVAWTLDTRDAEVESHWERIGKHGCLVSTLRVEKMGEEFGEADHFKFYIN